MLNLRTLILLLFAAMCFDAWALDSKPVVLNPTTGNFRNIPTGDRLMLPDASGDLVTIDVGVQAGARTIQLPTLAGTDTIAFLGVANTFTLTNVFSGTTPSTSTTTGTVQNGGGYAAGRASFFRGVSTFGDTCGVVTEFYSQQTVDPVAYRQALRFLISSSGATAGNSSVTAGVVGLVQNVTAGVTWADVRAFEAQIDTATATSTNTTAAGYYFKNGGNSGTTTNKHAFYTEAVTGGTTNYAFRSAGAGLVSIGDTTSASSAIVGAVTIGNAVAATSVAIGGGKINAGDTTSNAVDGAGAIVSGGGIFADRQSRIIGRGANSNTRALDLQMFGNWGADPAAGRYALQANLSMSSATFGNTGVTGGLNFTITNQTAGITLSDVRCVDLSASSTNATAINTTVYGAYFGNGTSTGTGTTKTAFHSEALSGATTVYLLRGLGAGLVSIGDTTDSTSTGTGGIVSLSGAGFAKQVSARNYLATGGTITVSQPVFDATQTWNAGGVTFTGIKSNITDTASNLASLHLDLQTGGTSRFKVNKSGNVQITQAATSGLTAGQVTALGVTPGAHTTFAASAEVQDVTFGLARTIQWATGAVVTQRSVVISSPTISFVGASTVTNAATVAITAAPTAGTNATLTNAWALWIQAGTTRFDGDISLTQKQTIAPASAMTPLTLTGPTIATALPVLNMTSTWSAGGVTFTAIKLDVSDGASAAGSLLLDLQVTSGSKFNVDKAGLITTASATMIKSSVAFTNGAAAGAGTITNAPAAGNPTKWIPVNDNGTTRYIPAW